MTAIHGLLLLDKSQGLSSNQALQRVRHALGAAKGGHTGALDPLATGMLPLCFGESTRLAGLLLESDKAYSTIAQLGACSRTGDAEGELFDQRPVPPLDAARVEAVLAGFRGPIEQIPPMYSALKQGGRTLYSLARRGIEVERPARPVTIHALTCTAIDGDRLHLQVVCSKGTYIRTLVEDIGQALGCGAYVAALRRDWVAPFQGQPMHALDELLALPREALTQLLLPTDAGLQQLPALHLDADDSTNLSCGRPLQGKGWSKQLALPASGEPPQLIRAYDHEQRLVAVGQIDAGGRLQIQARFGTGAGEGRKD